MIDFQALAAAFPKNDASKSENQSEACYLVLMTPTPLENSLSPYIGYVLVQRSPATCQSQIATPVVDHKWECPDLQEWLMVCAQDWLEGLPVCQDNKRCG